MCGYGKCLFAKNAVRVSQPVFLPHRREARPERGTTLTGLGGRDSEGGRDL
jgi:hypothetical protein